MHMPVHQFVERHYEQTQSEPGYDYDDLSEHVNSTLEIELKIRVQYSETPCTMHLCIIYCYTTNSRQHDL